MPSLLQDATFSCVSKTFRCKSGKDFSLLQIPEHSLRPDAATFNVTGFCVRPNESLTFDNNRRVYYNLEDNSASRGVSDSNVDIGVLLVAAMDDSCSQDRK